MKSARVVIGAGFGDEGKGLMTDYFAEPGGLVVRFNGGAQAGHTVMVSRPFFTRMPEGYHKVTTMDYSRHVFHHFGSGTFQGATTCLSRFFIVNPMVFVEECEQLRGLGLRPTVIIDPSCPVTTPYEMILNQIMEERRGDQRHGSCGLGINETVQHAKFGGGVSMRMLSKPSNLADALRYTRDYYVMNRLSKLRIPLRELSEDWQRRLKDDSLIDMFVEFG